MENFAPCPAGQGAVTFFGKFNFMLDLDAA